MPTILDYLQEHGPSRSASIVQWLTDSQGVSPEAARKRVSRIATPIERFPVPMLPKGESFVYTRAQRTEEWFWPNFLISMRDSNSIFGVALDGLVARKGAVRVSEFPVVSGATTNPIKGQLTADSVAERLIRAGAVGRRLHTNGDQYLEIVRSELCTPDMSGMDARGLAEGVILEGVRSWARNIGLASFNSVRIRGESDRAPVGPFLFDLAGPSYLLPVKGAARQPGFFAADVFTDGTLDVAQIQFFIRKASIAHSLLRKNGGGIMAMLVADGFTSAALQAGHSAGVILATPKELFGRRAAEGLRTLVQTLQNAAAYASSAPERLTKLLDSLAEIQGAAGNVRGILFELISAYLVRRDAVSIDVGRRARHPVSGQQADIDILKLTSQNSSCTAIECKGREPGGTVTLEEVQDWLRRIPIFQAYLKAQPHLREANLSFEMWTSGTFESDALAYLEAQKKTRTKTPIAWLDGNGVLALAAKHKEKAIGNALREHFVGHPLSQTGL